MTGMNDAGHRPRGFWFCVFLTVVAAGAFFAISEQARAEGPLNAEDLELRLLLSGRPTSWSEISDVMTGKKPAPPSLGELRARKKKNSGADGGDIRQLTVKNGDLYAGEVRNGRPHGSGIYTWTDGGYYEGAWIDGKRHGRGKLVTAEGGEYVGEFRDGKVMGKGVYRTKSGYTYDGVFNGSLAEGEGTVTGPDGYFRRGSWSKKKAQTAKAKSSEERKFPRLKDRSKASSRNNDRSYGRLPGRNGAPARRDNGWKSYYVVSKSSIDSVRPGQLYPARFQTDNAKRRRNAQYLLYHIRRYKRNGHWRKCYLTASGTAVDEYRVRASSFDRHYTRLKRKEENNTSIRGDVVFFGEATARQKARRVARDMARRGWSVMNVARMPNLPPKCRSGPPGR